MRIANDWSNFEVVDAGDGVKIERYNSILLQRPDPVASWPLSKSYSVDAWFDSSWHFNKHLAQEIHLDYKDLRFQIMPTTFKHTGIFPEQAINWDWMRSVIQSSNKQLRILNLFGYTGGATVACAKEDNVIEVVHIDALKSLNNWTKTNISLNNLDHKTVRTINEDAMKFLDRELRRGRTYHGIIMDPPSYGKGPKGEVWRIEQQLEPLLEKAVSILDRDALFIVLNTYTTNLPQSKVQSSLNQALKRHNFKLTTHTDGLGLPITNSKKVLSCGVTTRWCYDENLL